MSILPLTHLFQGARSPDLPVALNLAPAGSPPRVRTWAEFTSAAAGAADQARAAGGRRWVLACPEAWDFAAGLFGLLLAGRTVVLPPNFLPQTLEELEREADGALWEIRSRGTVAAGTLLSGKLEFWTSGSTGEPKAVPKDLAQLDAEVAMLERTFGHLLTAGPMVGTVPHHHIYGCLFRLLWPLAAGRPFLCEPAGDPDGFRQALGLAVPALVASPAHLSRLPQLLDLGAIPRLPAVLFSSGGPLNASDAQVWRRWVPGGVVEIYGSTETGGIAWRNQGETAESADWTPFDDVALAFEDGALVVTSFRAGPGPLRLEDGAVPAAGGRFRLLGRLDRTIKLEEKRVSLPELERALETQPWVARASVVLLEGRRPALGAVVVLKPGAPSDRAVLVQALRAHLALRFDGLAVPRRWRFPEALPYDARGKLTARALGGLFLAGPRPEPGSAGPHPLPAILRRDRLAQGEASFTLAIGADLPAFQGHFPGDPVLPGVVQVDWAIRLAQETFGPLGGFQGLDQVKFQAAIRPGTEIQLRLSLERTATGSRLGFHYLAGTGRLSCGRVLFLDRP